MELHELEVGQPGAGPRGHGQAVAGRLLRVGGAAGRAGRRPPVASTTAGGQVEHAPAVRRAPPARPPPEPPVEHAGRRRRRPRSLGTSGALAHRRDAGCARSRRRWRRRAWRMRRRLCAASRPRASAPAASRSKWAPSVEQSRARRAGPSSVEQVDDAGSFSPAPAARVSAACRAGRVVRRPSAAAMPPWAQGLEPPAQARLGEHA